MNKIARRIAVVIGAVAVSAGLLGGTVAPANADIAAHVLKDTSWGR